MSSLQACVLVLASALLTAPFWWSGLSKLCDFSAAKAEARNLGLRPPALVASVVILVQLTGTALVVSGQWVWLGAAALAAFTLVASLKAHAFWKAPVGPVRVRQRNAFVANLGLIGGLMLVVMARGQGAP